MVRLVRMVKKSFRSRQVRTVLVRTVLVQTVLVQTVLVQTVLVRTVRSDRTDEVTLGASAPP
jgi:hypothetical protein